MIYTASDRTVTKTLEWQEEDVLLDAINLRGWLAEQITAFLAADIAPIRREAGE